MFQKGRDFNNNYIDKQYLTKILNSSIKPKKLMLMLELLRILFYGRNYLHRVTPVTSKKT